MLCVSHHEGDQLAHCVHLILCKDWLISYEPPVTRQLCRLPRAAQPRMLVVQWGTCVPSAGAPACPEVLSKLGSCARPPFPLHS